MKILLLQRNPITSMRITSILFFLATFVLYSIIVCSCSSETGRNGEQQKSEGPVKSETDTAKQELSHKSILDLKKKIISKRQNPILTAAHSNSHFNANKWLKSDFHFHKRPNPRKISDYDPVIKKMARRYGFDWRLIAAQIYAESNFKNEATSHVGAMGLMQIMPSTAKFMGYDPKTMIDPKMNIAVGCMYDQRMYSLWGKQIKDYNRLAFALASYNAGRGRVLKSYSTKDNRISWNKVHPLLPEETQSYVHKIYLKHDLYKRYILP